MQLRTATGWRPQEPDASIIAYQGWFATQAPSRVVVPFATRLGEFLYRLSAVVGPRRTRDVARVLAVTKSVPILNAHRRDRDGTAPSSQPLEDYDVAYQALALDFGGQTHQAGRLVREAVEAVATLGRPKVLGAFGQPAKARRAPRTRVQHWYEAA